MRYYPQQLILLHCLFRFLSIFALTAGGSVGDVECHPEQRYLLLHLKQSFSLPSSELISWQPGSNCCKWEGITCNSKSGWITSIDLHNHLISGYISSNLFNITSLQVLKVAFHHSNKNPIPPSGLEKLTKLTHLGLSNAAIVPHIAIGISHLTSLISLNVDSCEVDENSHHLKLQTLIRNLSNLKELYLGCAIMSNDIEWTRELSTSVPQLQELSLHSCDLPGLLPLDFFTLKNWTVLHFAQNPRLSVILPDFSKDSALQSLQLSSMKLSRNIIDSVGNLKYLEDLEISGCGVNGMIPSSIGNLKNIVRLDLSFNNFTGLIPTSIGNLTRLEYLNLSSNHLNGPIPLSLFSLPVLHTLDLHSNQLSDKLKNSSSTINSMENIFLSNNQLQGHVILPFSKLQALVHLDLSSNGFRETLQLDMFESLNNLTSLDLSNNRWSSISEVSDYYFHSFPKLESLILASCNLTKIPTFLKYQDKLRCLDLSNNKIGGDIPKWLWSIGNSSLATLNLSCNLFTKIGGLPELSLHIQKLDLHSNMLRGPIPISLSPSSYLDFSLNFFSSELPYNISSYLKNTRIVLLAYNTLTGEIPQSICEASQLEILDLSKNRLVGSIPPCLLEGNPYGLYGLNLRGNQLRGIIPQNISTNLQTLILNGNQLEGPLPRSLANSICLTILDVGNNRLMDYFPFWLGNVTTLRVLILRGNGFYGSVRSLESHGANYTFSDLQILDLSSNHFHGNLSPKFFHNLKVMVNSSKLDSSTIGINNYYGSFYQNIISVTIKGQELTLEKILGRCTSIDFFNNSFEGNIPSVIGKLQSLHVLNLSRNALTGKIPSEIGNLKQLESLDLSRNHLSGNIPQELSSLNFLGTLNLSNNNLVGRIPQGNQLSTFSNTSFEGNPGLCGSPLSMQCGNANPNRTGKLSQSKSDSSSFNYVIFLALFIGLGFGTGMALVLVFQNLLLKCSTKNDAN